MKIVVVGNGALGLAIARQICKNSPESELTLIGPSDLEGSGTAAAAAMLTCYAEIEKGSLDSEIEKAKFELSRKALLIWRDYLQELDSDINLQNDNSYGFGTFLINTSTTDQLDDQNFDQIVDVLNKYNENYSKCDSSDIPNYKPKDFARARRSIFLPNEGWINPRVHIMKLHKYLRSKNVQIIDNKVQMIKKVGANWELLLEKDSISITCDLVILANGANVQEILSESKLGLVIQKIFYGAGASVELELQGSNHSKCIRTPNRGLACGIYSAPFNSFAENPAVLVGATNFISKDPVKAPRLTSLKTLLENAENEINEDFYKAEVRRVNLGWRPTSQDTFPLVGATSMDGLIIATGTKRDGVHLSPIVAEFIYDLIFGGKISHQEFESFKPERELIWTMNREQGISKAVEHKYNGFLQHGMRLSNSNQIAKFKKDIETDLIKLYNELNIGNFGLPVELLDMYRYGHAKVNF